jgi:uncharacterized tellurite resistance protein B-like protein
VPIVARRSADHHGADAAAAPKARSFWYTARMVSKLSRPERMRLMRFVCSFAWADLEVQDEERAFVARLMSKLDLDDDERRQVEGWLKVPPPPEEVDPSQVPRAHRKLFLDTVRQVVAADSKLDPEESETLTLFEQLLR